MDTPAINKAHEENYVRIAAARLRKAAQLLEEYAGVLRDAADKLPDRPAYAEAAANAVGQLGNYLANAGTELAIQHAATADVYRELARQGRELEAEGLGE